MVKIENEKQYKGALKRVEELMLSLPENTPKDYPEMVELELLGNLVADYEEEHYPIGKPSLIDTIKLRMYEMGLSHTSLAKLIGVSPSRICDYLSGKSEPTMKVGKPQTKHRPCYCIGSITDLLGTVHEGYAEEDE